MKYVLIDGSRELVIGPFECPEDAISYAVNVIGTSDFVVKPLQYPMSAANHRLLERITA